MCRYSQYHKCVRTQFPLGYCPQYPHSEWLFFFEFFAALWFGLSLICPDGMTVRAIFICFNEAIPANRQLWYASLWAKSTVGGDCRARGTWTRLSRTSGFLLSFLLHLPSSPLRQTLPLTERAPSQTLLRHASLAAKRTRRTMTFGKILLAILAAIVLALWFAWIIFACYKVISCAIKPGPDPNR